VQGAIDRVGADLREWCIVSQLAVAPLAEATEDAVSDAEIEGLKVRIALAEGEKCPRCWIRSTELGTDAAYPEVCPRCAAALKAMNVELGD